MGHSHLNFKDHGKEQICKITVFLLHNKLSVAAVAIELAFTFPVEREETEPPFGFYVGGLDRASAVGTCPRSWLPRQDPLVLIAHKHQTHLFFSFVFLLSDPLLLGLG